jgi:hypothetical protein
MDRVVTARPAGPLVSWAGVLLGPLAFALDLQLGYSLVYEACERQSMLLLHLVGAGALLVLTAGALAAWRVFRDASEDGRARFLGRLGLLSSAFFLLVLLGQALPRLVLGPCD